MSIGQNPGIDGLLICIKSCWRVLEQDPFLPLVRLPKKRELALLKNWRPVALLCTDDKNTLQRVFQQVEEHLRNNCSLPPKPIVCLTGQSWIMYVIYISKCYNINFAIVCIVSGVCQDDIQVLQRTLSLDGKSSSAPVNRGRRHQAGPSLPGGREWGKVWLAVWGVFLGTDYFQTKSWEGVKEKVCAGSMEMVATPAVI